MNDDFGSAVDWEFRDALLGSEEERRALKHGRPQIVIDENPLVEPNFGPSKPGIDMGAEIENAELLKEFCSFNDTGARGVSAVLSEVHAAHEPAISRSALKHSRHRDYMRGLVNGALGHLRKRAKSSVEFDRRLDLLADSCSKFVEQNVR